MNIVISVEVTLRGRMRNVRAQLRWVGWLIRAVGVGYLIWATSAGVDIGLLLLGLVYLFGPEALGAIRHLMARRFGRTYTYTLTDDGIVIRTVISNLEFTWAAVKSIRQTRTLWFVRLPGGGFALPKRLFTPDQAAEWHAFLGSRRLVRV